MKWENRDGAFEYEVECPEDIVSEFNFANAEITEKSECGKKHIFRLVYNNTLDM